MASSPSVERTTGLDLNTGELEEGSTNSGAALVSDTGGEVSIPGECLVVRNSEGNVLTADGIADCSDAAEMTGSLGVREEKKNCASSSLLSGREASCAPESRGTETGGVVELDVVAGVAKEAKKVQDESKPAEFEKSGHEVETFEKFKSSSMDKTSAEKVAQSGNMLEGQIRLAGNNEFEAHLALVDESEAQGKVEMYYKETEEVIKTAEAMDAHDPGENSNTRTQCPASEKNFVVEKDKFFENEDGAELEDTINDEKQDNTLSDSFGYESVGSQLQDKLIVLDSASSGNSVSVGIYKPEISVFGGEHGQENAETATFAFDGDETEGTVDTPDPGIIQAEISETKYQSECKEEPLSMIIELSGDGISCPDNAIQEANDDSADKQLDAAETDLDADVMDDGAEVDGTPNQILAQNGAAIKLPQLCLSTAGEKKGSQKEVVSCSAINEQLHGTNITVVGSSGQNEGSTHNPAVLTGEMEVFPIDNHNKSPELDGQTDAGDSSVLHGAENKTLINELPNIDLIQNAQVEEYPVQQKQSKEVGLGSTDGVENSQVINDKINSDLAIPIVEVDMADKDPLGEYIPDVSFMITTDSDADIDIRVAESDTVDINLLEAHMAERFSGEGTETDMEIDRWNMKNNESTAMADDSVTNPPVLMSSNQFILDDKINVGDTRFSSSSLVLEAKSSDQDMIIDEKLPKGDKQTLIHAARPGISIEDIGEHACYYFPSKDEDGYSISDLVWGKVKSHPWWPGQIFDVSDASDLALKYQKQDNFLVAYFGDKTFAWCDESQLKHFEIHFMQLEKQSSSDVFTNAVNGALDEFSRRIELGMTCFCLPEDSGINYKKVENAGICKGSNGYVLDRPAILSYFEPDKLFEYIKNLAQFPDSGTDRLSLVVANSQLKAFFRSNLERTSFKLFDEIIDCDDEVLHLDSESIGKDLFKQSNHIFCDPGELNAQGLGKHILEDGKRQKCLSELMEPEVSQQESGIIIRSYVDTDHDSFPFSFSKKHKVIDVDSSDSARSKKRRTESVGDMEMNVPSSATRSSFKVGEYIRRVASQLTGSSSNLRTPNETSLKTCKGDSVYDDFASDGLGDTVMETPSFEPDDLEYDASPDELFLLLHSVARDPTEGYDYLSSVSSFFSKFRNYCVFSSASEEKHPVEERAEKDKKRKVEGLSVFPEVIEGDHMLDSYWSDLMPHNHPAKIKVEAHTPIQRKRRKTSRQTSALVSVPVVQATEHIQIGIARPSMKQVLSSDRPVISVNAKMVDKFTPTALILNFNGSTSLPSDTDLIRIFSRYGPIVETAIEVHPKNNSVKVVFKRRTDAEMAFSSAGKYGWFGPSLLSYHLSCLSSTLDTSADIQQSNECPALPEQSSNFETPGKICSFMSCDLTETNDQDGTEISDINIIHLPTGNDSDSKLKNTCDAEPTECIHADIPSDHPSVSNAYVDTNSSNQSELLLTGNGRTDTAVVHTPDRTDTTVALHTPVSDASPDTGLQMQSDTGTTEDSNTGIPGEVHSSVLVAPPDSDQQSQIDAVVVQSSTPNVLCDIHPLRSDTYSDANLQNKSETASDIILQENSYAVIRSTASDIHNELHPSMCEAPLLDNPHGEGDAVTIASRSVASLDSDVPNQSEAVSFDNNNKNCPCDLHPSTYYTSVDANLQEKHETESDIIVSDVVLRDSTAMHSELHASICDTFADADLQEKSDAVVRSTDSEIPNEFHPSVCEVPLPDNLHDEGDTTMIESRSVAAIDSDVPNQSEAVPLDSITNLPRDLHPPTHGASADANLQEKHEKVLDSTISDVIIRDSAGIHGQLHSSISDAPILNNLLAKSDAGLIERSVTSLDSDEQNKTDAVLKESSTTNLPCGFHPPLSDFSPVLQEKCETVANINLDENSNAVFREHNDSDIDSPGHGTLPDSLLNNLHGESDVVMAASSETQLPGNIHPSICHASAEATFQSESDAVPTKNSNVNSSEIVHGSLLDTPPEP